MVARATYRTTHVSHSFVILFVQQQVRVFGGGGGAERSKEGIQHVEATSSLLFVLEVVKEINSTTLLIKASRSVWHNYFPLYITLHVRSYEC